VVMEEAADKEAEGIGEAVVGDGEVAEVRGGHREGGSGGVGSGRLGVSLSLMILPALCSVMNL